jgi:hypothetical protein
LRSKTALVPVNPLPGTNGFEDFWTIYLRKKGKAKAQLAWRKVKPEEVGAIIARVELNNLGEWKDRSRQYIPYPATWLNERRWEDETDPVPAAAAGLRPEQSDHLPELEALPWQRK